MKRKTTKPDAAPRIGRPPKPAEDRLVPLSMRVHPTIRAKFTAHCARKGKSQAVVFAAWVKRHIYGLCWHRALH